MAILIIRVLYRDILHMIYPIKFDNYMYTKHQYIYEYSFTFYIYAVSALGPEPGSNPVRSRPHLYITRSHQPGFNSDPAEPHTHVG